MKVRFNRWYNAVLTVLLSIFGYGCSSDDTDYAPMYGVVMYGAPATEFQVKGQVTDEAGMPVQGIKTSLTVFVPTIDGQKAFGLDSVQTDDSGQYLLKYYGFQSDRMMLVVEDIDGEANGGEFHSDTLDIDFGKAVKVIDSDMDGYGASYEIHQDIKLNKK